MSQLRSGVGRAATLVISFLLLTAFPRTAWAHTPSETYLALTLTGTNLTGQWDVALRDLQQGLRLETMEGQVLSVE